MIVNNKVAVITGAASGIGYALARAFLSDGLQVVMADVNSAELQEKVEQLSELFHTRVFGVVCDVTKLEDLQSLTKQTFECFRRVDLLINNAGISGHFAPLWELPTGHIRHVLDVNLHGVINGIQVFLPLLFKQQFRAHVINMASFYGLCSGSQMAAYTMSKHAIVALSESLYFDLKRLKKPVDVSVGCPSFVKTQLIAHSTPKQTDKLHSMLGDLMERCRPAEDVANCIIREIKNKAFYILPDKEVKNDCEQRTKAIIDQTVPYEHGLEKIIASLSKRAMAV